MREEKRDWERMGLCGFNEKETKKEIVILVFKSRLVFLLFLFKIHLDLNSCDFWFFILVLIFFI